MAAFRPESFQLALQTLRGQLHDGVFPPGARITASEVAAELQLSPTPVREALAWLAGEGVVEERRGQGYFIRHLTASDIADLYRQSLALLLIATDPDRPQLARRAAEGVVPRPPIADPVIEVERLFVEWIAEGSGRVMAAAHRVVQIQLGPVRRLEALIIPNLLAEADLLSATRDPERATDRLHRLRHFHARRVRVADRLASLLMRRGEGPENRVDIV